MLGKIEFVNKVSAQINRHHNPEQSEQASEKEPEPLWTCPRLAARRYAWLVYMSCICIYIYINLYIYIYTKADIRDLFHIIVEKENSLRDSHS